MAVYYAATGDYEKAFKEASRARELNPKDVTVLLKCIQVFEMANKRDQALQTLQEYINRGGIKEEIDKIPYLAEFSKDPRCIALFKK